MSPASTHPWDLRLEVLRAGNNPLISLAGRCGVVLEVPLSDLLIASGQAAGTIELVGLHAGLPAPQWHQLLRQCRFLLRPGGVLRLPEAAGAGSALAEQIEEVAWLCGFDAEVAHSNDSIQLTVPRRSAVAGGSPQVSIVIPAFKSRFFSETLQSALKQTHPDFEILVCDDSPDAAIGEIVSPLAATDSRIRYLRNPENLGGRRNYLQSFAEARGRYVKFLNDDDLLHPDCLSRMSACLDAFPAVTLVTSYRQLVDAEGRFLPDHLFNRPVVARDSLLDGRTLATRVLANQVNVIGEPSTVMFRKEDALGNRPHLMSYAGRSARKNGDLSLWVTLLSRGDVVYLADPLSSFRQHDQQVQRDPAFRAEAVLAWRELQAAAIETGLINPACLNHGRSVGLAAPGGTAAWDLVRRAEDRFLGENLDEAADLLRSALNTDPDCARARNDLAAVYWHAGLTGPALLESLLGLCCAQPSETAVLNLRDMLTDTGHEVQARALEEALACADRDPVVV